VPNFDQVRMKMLDHIDPLHRVEIMGSTDSEDIFRYLLSLFLHHPERGLLETVRQGLRQVLAWSSEVDPTARVGLNIVLTDGEHMIGSRYNRTLVTLRRDKVFICPICSMSHVHHEAQNSYRAIEIASEPITKDDDWVSVPNETIFGVTEDYALKMEPLTS
jgi:predicted glutamine amidotransferase